MTMKRNEKAKADRVLKGQERVEHMSPKGRQMCRAERGGDMRMTPTEYARTWLGRRTVNAQTATAQKMERQGWRATERGGFAKLSRRG